MFTLKFIIYSEVKLTLNRAPKFLNKSYHSLVCLFVWSSFVSGKNLLHLVECRSCLKPSDLLFIEGVVQGDVFSAAVGVLNGGNDGLKLTKIHV